MKLAIAQLEARTADFEGSLQRIFEAAERARAQDARLLLLPRRVPGGEAAGALRRHPEFFTQSESALRAVAARVPADVTVVLGTEARQGDALVVLREGRVEQLDTAPVAVFEHEGRRIGAAQFSAEPHEIDTRVASLRERGAELVLVPGGQPFFVGGHVHRGAILTALARRHGVAIALAEAVGGSDSRVYDGGSLVVDASGRTLAEARRFEPDLLVADAEPGGGPRDPSLTLPRRPRTPLLPGAEIADIARALVTGIRDYVRESGFSRAIVGLSGGVDSAVVAVLGAEALGPENLLAVAMPSRYTSEMSLEDSRELARRLGIRLEEIAIEPMVEAFARSLESALGRPVSGLVQENLQARVRGTLLMALSAEHGALVLNTGNKSELAVGYCTLYGDMVGALGVLGDLPKTWVYDLARHLNLRHGAIPPRIITRPPSAELRPGQTDQDSLPPYDRLDRVLHLALEEEEGVAEMREAHADEETIRRTLSLLFASEFKRRQAVPAIRVTVDGLHEEAYPLVHRFRPWEEV